MRLWAFLLALLSSGSAAAQFGFPTKPSTLQASYLGASSGVIQYDATRGDLKLRGYSGQTELLDLQDNTGTSWFKFDLSAGFTLNTANSDGMGITDDGGIYHTHATANSRVHLAWPGSGTDGTVSITGSIGVSLIGPTVFSGPGGTLSSAATLTQVRTYHTVSGTAVISTVTPKASSSAGSLLILEATGAWSWDTGGNFLTAGTATSGRVYMFVYNGTKWVPLVTS